MVISTTTLRKVITKVVPGVRTDILDAIGLFSPLLYYKYKINSNLRMSHFLSQAAYESGGLRLTTENLNYSTASLISLFSNRITRAQAEQYGRNDQLNQRANEEAIANIIYGGEWGLKNLGNTQPGDGFKFIGRGLIQLTGRNNYANFAVSNDITIEDVVEYINTAVGCIESAAWFWNSRGLNNLADRDDVSAVTRRVNGGVLGLEQRIRYLTNFREALCIK